MNLAWRAYRLLCVAGFSLLLLAGGLIYGFGTLSDAWRAPIAASPSPDGSRKLLVFSAGQANLPPDYRAGVRFILYDPARLPGFRSREVASAAFADGWSIAWQNPRAVTIAAGRLSWFDRVTPRAWGVTVTLQPARAGAEHDCIGQAFRSTIDGVTCFDGLLHAAAPPR